MNYLKEPYPFDKKILSEEVALQPNWITIPKARGEAEMRFFDFYARHLWPLHRPFVIGGLSKRCGQCGLSEKASVLVKGLCQFCRDPLTQDLAYPGPQEKERLSKEVDELLNTYQGKGTNSFDAVLLFIEKTSSIHLLNLLKNRFPKLRVLCVNVDDTFLRGSVFLNSNRLLQQLNVPIATIRPSETFYEKVFRYAFLNCGNRLSTEIINQFNLDILHDIARNVAARYRIPLVLSGIQAGDVIRYFRINHYETPRATEEKERTHILDFKLSLFLNKNDLLNFWNGNLCAKEDIPRVIFPFYAWEYQAKAGSETLAKLEGPSQKQRMPAALQSSLWPLMGAVDITHLGYSGYEFEFANQIRSGRVDKRYWQSILEMQEYAVKRKQFLNKSIGHMLQRLFLTPEELYLR